MTAAEGTHVKVQEEIYPNDCIDGACEHAQADPEIECPVVLVDVCSDCRESAEDGAIVILTSWAAAEAAGHVLS